MDIFQIHLLLYCLFEKIENKQKEAEDGPLKKLNSRPNKILPKCSARKNLFKGRV